MSFLLVPQLKYAAALHLSTRDPLVNPRLNISDTGFVSTTPQTFCVELACSGLLDAEIDVRLNLNITLNKSNNVTNLTFRRRKICYRGGFDYY